MLSFSRGRQLKAHPHNSCYELCIPLLCSKLSMNSFSVEEHAVYHIEFISQRQCEETQIDPLSQSLLVEHRHVNMTLAGPPIRNRRGRTMAPLSLSAKASTSRLTRLSGLSHGMKPSKCSVLQPFKIASVVLVVVLAINSVVLMKSDFDETFNMVQHCKDLFPLEINFT